MGYTNIIDGSGDEYRAKVDNRHRLFTDAISRSQLEYAVLTGNGYNVSTGNIALTTDGESALGYFKYTGENTVVIKEILVKFVSELEDSWKITINSSVSSISEVS